MEEEIINCFIEAIFEELSCINADTVIDRTNIIFEKRKVPYKLWQNEDTLEYEIEKIDNK